MKLEKLGGVDPKAESNDYQELQKLLEGLEKRELPEEVVFSINEKIQGLNSFSGPLKKRKIQITTTKLEVLTLLEKKLKLVTKNQSMMLWIPLGMSFGLLLGSIFSTAMDNIGLMPLGLPIGLVIGMAIGHNMDKKALEEGRQLEI